MQHPPATVPHLAPHTVLLRAESLQALLASGQPCMVFDCSFDLGQPQAGRAQYQQAHIPGAVYAHLDADLSAQPDDPAPASGGRHPLPSRQRFAQWLRAIGFCQGMQAVVYDRQGANYAGRLWWMLKWAGHEAVAVLDGGLQAWQAAGGALASGPAQPVARVGDFALQAPLRLLLDVEAVARSLGQPDAPCLLDARAPERYRGEVEPLDPVAGHVPGALNRPFTANIALDGRFKPAALLRAEFEALLAGRDPATVAHYCGSGVSALPNMLAMEAAGLGPTALMAGSWSQWCSQGSRPVARGAG